MVQKWVELKKAKEILNVELEYLYDRVVEGTVKTAVTDKKLMVEISELQEELLKSVRISNNSFNNKNKENITIKNEYQWLKAENMRNTHTIKSYHEKFNELKKINEELMQVVNEQSNLIKHLKRLNENVKYDKLNYYPERRSNNVGISLWMLLPLIGLLLTACIEINKCYNIVNFKALFTALGM